MICRECGDAASYRVGPLNMQSAVCDRHVSWIYPWGMPTWWFYLSAVLVALSPCLLCGAVGIAFFLSK
jgi:hypothetical protein